MRNDMNTGNSNLTSPLSTPRNGSLVTDRTVTTSGFVNRKPDSERDRIRVTIRMRPLNSYETDRSTNEIVTAEDSSIVVEGKAHDRKFNFDAVMPQSATQEDCFEYSGVKRLIEMAIDGYVATCFAYGQTGSGKTYTMTGPPGSYNARNRSNTTYFGLIPRSINYLFDKLRERSLQSNALFYIRVSYFEIYNEQIRDLINPYGSGKLEVRGSPEEGFFVENLFATYIENMDEILTILDEGEVHRANATHVLNDHSSRSHAVLTIQVENEQKTENGDPMTTLGKLIFVDLAGSEKIKITQPSGKQLTETNSINKSLLALGTCIAALSNPTRREGFIPYRDSKLTKLLCESLGGSGITLMIATISPSSVCENETLSTLRYANRARNIQNIPLIKSDSKENIILKLKRELRRLKFENQMLKQKIGVVAPVNKNPSATTLPRLARNGSTNSSVSSDVDVLLGGKLKEFINENKTLKTENTQLTKMSERIRKQHEKLTKENEFLARKLEKVLRVQGVNPSDFIEQQSVPEEENGGTFPKIEQPDSKTKKNSGDTNRGSKNNKKEPSYVDAEDEDDEAIE